MNKVRICTLVPIAALVLISLFILSGQSLAAPVSDSLTGIIPQKLNQEQTNSAVTLDPQPHPILSDLNVRRAIAYCTDKDALVAAAYPELTPTERQELVSETFLHPTNWAYSEPEMTYDYNPATGGALLEAAGWLLPPAGDIRVKEGNELVLTVKSTASDLRLAYLPVFESQMYACGIRMIREHRENIDWFEGRDFELGNYAWIFGDEPGGTWLYDCYSIPSPYNGWEGGNVTGWCNMEATDAIIQADDTTLSQDVRKDYFAIFIDLFAEDMPVLPLFWREGTTTWEHIDLNLETYAQTSDLTPAGTGSSDLTFVDYQEREHIIAAPAGAVTQTIGLSFYPMPRSTNEPEGVLVTNAFRINALVAGVPQDEYELTKPLTLTIDYNPAHFVDHLVESSLVLYVLNEETGEWEDAFETCAEGERYVDLDMETNLYSVHICHLSEFSLYGRGGDGVRMGVNYGLDEAAGMYELGHTFSITVTDSVGTVKASATVLTEAYVENVSDGSGPDFAWSDGFWVQEQDWSDPTLDIVPGDFVHFQSDDGFSETIQVGTITARLNPVEDFATGTVSAPWFSDPLNGFVGTLGLFGVSFTVDPDGGYFFADISPYDLTPYESTHVGYAEPDKDSVRSVFTAPDYGEYYLPFTIRASEP